MKYKDIEKVNCVFFIYFIYLPLLALLGDFRGESVCWEPASLAVSSTGSSCISSSKASRGLALFAALVLFFGLDFGIAGRSGRSASEAGAFWFSTSLALILSRLWNSLSVSSPYYPYYYYCFLFINLEKKAQATKVKKKKDENWKMLNSWGHSTRIGNKQGVCYH